MDVVVKLHALDWIIILGYIGFMLWVGFYFSKKSQGFDDYFMAGRDLTAPLLVGTLVSTFYGLDTLFGTSEIGFYEGISGFFAYSLPYTAMYVVMAFLAPVFKEKFPDGTTMQDICYRRYGRTAGITSSIAAFIYSTNTMEMMGIGFLLALVTPIPVWAGTIIGAIIVVVYTYTGGLWAVTMTDFIQFIIMMVTLGIAMIIGWSSFGGYEAVYQGLIEWCGEEPWYYFSPGAGYLSTATLVAYSITCLAVLAEPAFFQRVFAAAGPKEIKKAFTVGVPMWLAFDWIVTFLGILGAAAIGIGMIPEVEANQALMAIVGQYLPPGLLGLFIAGVLAASMSTADSYFLVSGGVVGYDLYKKVINPEATDKQVEKITKYGIIGSAIMSLGLTFVFDRIMEIWVFQATIILAVSLVPVYFGTFSKKPPKKIAGTLATTIGFALSFIWYIWTNFFGVWSDDWAVYVVRIGSWELWQEQGILLIVPIVIVIYLIANALGKETMGEGGVQ
ncbi:MAG: sodium:solute symporter family protein [Clostridia bacterium]|nr:sodium:solute symporter family protein [Clostridia bacterium]